MLNFKVKKWDKLDDWVIKMRKAASKNLTVFSFYEWKKSFVQTYKYYEYFIIYVYDNEELIWILPIQKFNNKIEFLWTPRCDYHEIIKFSGSEIDLKLILEYLKQTFFDCDISLSDYIYYENINNLWSNICILSLGEESQQIRDKLDKYCKLKTRKMDRKWYDLEFKSVNTNSEKKSFLPTLFMIHKSKRNSQWIQSQFDSTENKELYYHLIDNLPNENTQINLLLSNWNVIAIHFWFMDQNRFYYYKSTYDIEFKRYSPWILITKFLIDYAIKNKCKMFDYLRGNESYKQSISNIKINNSFLSY